MLDMTPHPPNRLMLTWPDEILDLRDTLLEVKRDAPVYVVGGAVRDALLRRPVKDLDLATGGNAIKLGRRIANHLQGDFYVLDAERGVARVLLEALTIDIAHFRGDDLLADLQGRDFAINAMAVDFFGDLSLLIDPLDGEQDAFRKWIQRCTPTSIADDPIRALRAVRQSVQHGFRIEPKTQRDVRAQAAALSSASPERVRDEFFAMLALKRPTQALRVADALGLLDEIVPQVVALKGVSLPEPMRFDGWKHAIETVDQLHRILTTISYRRTDSTAASFAMGMLAMQFDQFRADLNTHINHTWPDHRSHWALLLFGALLNTTGYVTDGNPVEEAVAIAETTSGNLHLSNGEVKRLTAMLQHRVAAHRLDVSDKLALHRYWYPLHESGIDALVLALAHYLASYGNELIQDDWLAVVERALVLLEAYFLHHEEIVRPPTLINGKELMDVLQLEQGPVVGELLTRIREAQVLGEVTNRDEALAVARSALPDMP